MLEATSSLGHRNDPRCNLTSRTIFREDSLSPLPLSLLPYLDAAYSVPVNYSPLRMTSWSSPQTFLSTQNIAIPITILYFHVFIYLIIYLFTYYIYIFIYFIYLLYLHIYLHIYLFTYSFIFNLFIYLFIYLCILGNKSLISLYRFSETSICFTVPVLYNPVFFPSSKGHLPRVSRQSRRSLMIMK